MSEFKIPEEFKKGSVAHTIRFTESLWERLHQTAVKQDISFNSLVVLCCNFALDHLKEDDESDS